MAKLDCEFTDMTAITTALSAQLAKLFMVTGRRHMHYSGKARWRFRKLMLILWLSDSNRA